MGGERVAEGECEHWEDTYFGFNMRLVSSQGPSDEYYFINLDSLWQNVVWHLGRGFDGRQHS